MFRYGQTFGRAAEDCVTLFLRQQSDRQMKMETEVSKYILKMLFCTTFLEYVILRPMH